VVRRVKVTGGELFADVEGDGPPVVLVHSGVTDARQWEAVTALIQRRMTVVRYDRRGYGRSAKYKRGRYSASLDLLELLDGLALERVVACGNSAGGEALLEAAALQPERFARLVLLAPATWPWEPSEPLARYAEAEEAALAEGDLDRAIALSVDMWVHRDEHREPVATMLRRALENQRKRPFEEFGLEDPPLGERLDRITCPVRILVGEHDVEDFRAIAWKLVDGLPDATAEEVPDAGHLLGLEAPELVASTL
jgi:pimeloyl-ACP methyl ester carboxylesterase